MTSFASKKKHGHRVRAIAKLRKELSKDIGVAVEIASACGLWDLLRYCYLLRLNRSFVATPERREKLSYADLSTVQLRDEALKYAAALVAKHGKWRDDLKLGNSLNGFDNERVQLLERVTRHINTKFETEKLLHIFDVRVQGARDQDCLLDLASIPTDPKRIMYKDFGLRIEKSTARSKDDLLTVEALLDKLRGDFADMADLFAAETGISFDAYCKGMLEVSEIWKIRGEVAHAICEIKHETVDPEAKETFVAFARSMLYTDTELEAALTPEFIAYLKRNPFDAANQSDAELRFHYLSRRPFLIGNGFVILSPELVYDSVNSNMHFTLLESQSAKDKYKNHGSRRFIDQIASIASQAGYQETARDVYLKKGKNDLGDIDLVLRHDVTGHSILIEAKNHALPLGVYFVSPDVVEEHAERTRDWEKKVQRRIDHLCGSAPSYSLPGTWDYLIVSRMPEPLSHLSNLRVLSLAEFEHWVRQDPLPTTFNEVYNALYVQDRATMSIDELQALRDDGFILGHTLDE